MKFTEHNEIVMEKFASMIIERIEKMQASDWKQGWIGRTIGEARKHRGQQISGLQRFLADDGLRTEQLGASYLLYPQAGQPPRCPCQQRL